MREIALFIFIRSSSCERFRLCFCTNKLGTKSARINNERDENQGAARSDTNLKFCRNTCRMQTLRRIFRNNPRKEKQNNNNTPAKSLMNLKLSLAVEDLK